MNTAPTEGRGSRYQLVSLGSTMRLPLSKERYERILNANALLAAGLAVEEAIEILVRNFFDFQRTMMSIALEHSLCTPDGDDFMEADRLEVTRQLNNLLSTGRLYLDHTKHHLAAASPQGRRWRPFTEFPNVQKAVGRESVALRAMNALRDYLQHQALPIDTIIYSHTLDDQGHALRTDFEAFLDIAALRRDPKFKPLIKELRGLADREGHIPLAPMVRGYVAALGAMHRRVRDLVKDEMIAGDAVIAEVRREAERYIAEDQATPAAFKANALVGLSVEHRRGGRQHSVSTMPTQRRKKLERKNRNLAFVSKGYISMELRQRD